MNDNADNDKRQLNGSGSGEPEQMDGLAEQKRQEKERAEAWVREVREAKKQRRRARRNGSGNGPPEPPPRQIPPARLTKHGRPDRRYRDPDKPARATSEKRMTIFVTEDMLKELRRQVAYFHIHNAQTDADSDNRLPASPTALIREAIEFWLDKLRLPTDARRADSEWDERLELLAEAIEKYG